MKIDNKKKKYNKIIFNISFMNFKFPTSIVLSSDFGSIQEKIITV